MGKPLVIVESPAKARTIARFLGGDYQVEASVGHIRDLARKKSELTKKLQGVEGAEYSVDIGDGFKALYVTHPDKKDLIKHLKKCLEDAPALYLATDEDREGESISWHLLQALKPDPKLPIHRLVFHEVTASAIQKALDTPRFVDENLVRAQEARRIVDRLFGYPMSNLLWRKIRPSLSAGRVQSVAVRLVVDRERARMAHTSAEWWDIRAMFQHPEGSLDANLTHWQGARIATGKDFDSNGKLKNTKLKLLDAAGAKAACEAMATGGGVVSGVDERPYVDKPSPPFTTSTLQQEANRRLKWTAKRTMSAAQRLYENGWITYMRTDSITLSKQAIAMARSLIKAEYGDKYLPDSPRLYSGKSKNAQEAHEAIRPSGDNFRSLAEAKRELGADEQRLYELIWKRTVGCQMENARGRTVTVRIAAGDGSFEVKGKTVDFHGYRLAYIAGSDDPEAAAADMERLLPPVKADDVLSVDDFEARKHATKPPPRLTEAALVKELEERGIGRPSTFASIIDTILRRDYVFKKGTALVPTWTAFAVTRLLESEHFSWLVEYDFTARMENDLDGIAEGKGERTTYLENFWGTLQESLKVGIDAIDPRTVCTIDLGELPAKVCKSLKIDEETHVVVRVGKFGPFLQAGEITANIPDELPPDEMTIEKASELLQGPKVLGVDPETGKDVLLANGRFGWYAQLGHNEEEEKPKRSSIPKKFRPDDVTLEMGLSLLSLPRNLGAHPTLGDDIMVHDGRYGPYVKCGKETRSIKDKNPLKHTEISKDECIELLAQEKAGSKRSEPLRELGVDPVTEQPIRLMDGRYGPYVKCGSTNASIGKGVDPDSLTLETAIELIRAREKAPKKKRPARRKKTATKKKK